jgi:hypothetical protein
MTGGWIGLVHRQCVRTVVADLHTACNTVIPIVVIDIGFVEAKDVVQRVASDFTKDRVLAFQVLGWSECNEELSPHQPITDNVNDQSLVAWYQNASID